MDAQRKQIAEEAGKKAVEEQLLKMREKDDQLAAMMKQIDDLKLKVILESLIQLRFFDLQVLILHRVIPLYALKIKLA